MKKQNKIQAIRLEIAKLDKLSFELVDNPKEYYKTRQTVWSLGKELEKLEKPSLMRRLFASR